MTPSINNTLRSIRTRLHEEAVAWGPNTQQMRPTNHGTSQPGEGGATNETNVADALDQYLGAIADDLVANRGMGEKEALAKINATARSLASDGVLPSLPSESSSDQDIAIWLGKAATIGFAQHVYQSVSES